MLAEPTALKKQPAGLKLDALARTDDAMGHLRAAERALLEEERQHAPHVGIRNQYGLIACADIATVLAEAQRQTVERLTGVPPGSGMSAIVGYAAPGSRLEIAEPAEPGRKFRVDLVRGDNGRRVCQAVGTDYDEAIMAAVAGMAEGLKPETDALAEIEARAAKTGGRV